MSTTHTPIHVDRFEAYLKQEGLSRTRPRRLVYKALAEAGPCKLAVIVASLDGQVDRATVYRTVEFFLASNVAVRAGNGVELGEAFKPHHHHLTCNNCGRAVSIDDETLESQLAAAAGRHNFKLETHQVELTGLCADCQPKLQAKAL